MPDDMPEFAISNFGVLSQDAQVKQTGICLAWAAITRVDVIAAPVRKPGDALLLELIGTNRKLVVPARKAVPGRLVGTRASQLGSLDQAQFLRALGNRSHETRFTVWQRPSPG